MGSSPGIRLGSLSGAPIYVAPSFAVLAILIGVVNAPSQAELGAFGQRAWLLPIGFVALLFVSVLLHELAHAVTGLAAGHRPTEIQVNIWGGHTQFTIAHPSAARSAVVAAAGPLSNLALAGLGWLTLFVLPPTVSITTQLVVSFVFVNLVLGVFNLVPGLPLDGGYLLESAVWGASGRRWKGTLVAGWVGRLVAVGLVGYAALRLLTGDMITTAVWGVLVAAVLWQAASAALRAADFRRRADHLDLLRLVRPAVWVPSGSSLEDVLRQVANSHQTDPQFAIVTAAAGPVGIVAPGTLLAVPPGERAGVSADQVAEPHHPGDVIELPTTGDQLVGRLAQVRSNNLVVVRDGHPVGVISGHELMSALTATAPGAGPPVR